MKNKALTIAGSVGIMSLLVFSGTAFAQTTTQARQGWAGRTTTTGAYRGSRGAGFMKPAVFGTVSAIQGDSLTVTSKTFGKTTSNTPTTYTVDATNATVFKNGATSTLSVVATGDTVMVQGTVSGTSVTATTIRDGLAPGMRAGMGLGGAMGAHGSSTQMRGGWSRGASSTMPSAPKSGSGIMHGIGNFIHNLFSFL